jgi:L-threonylcarbamoyladenylate synthase
VSANQSAATQVLEVDADHPDPSIIEQAVAVLRRGGLVALPTETVYGLAADATNADAVAKIFEAKQRPKTDPFIVHVSNMSDLQGIALDPPPLASALARAFWPGPLTLVLRRSSSVPAIVSAGLDTVAVRYPAHAVALALIRALGTPIAAPSANLFTRPSPTNAAHVQQDLGGRIDMILDGGPTSVGVESTVVDLTSDPPAVLRPGGVSIEALREIDPRIAYAPRHAAAGEAVSSPGMLLKHYSPRAEVRLFLGPRDAVLARMQTEISQLACRGGTVGALALSEDAASLRAAAYLVDLGSAERLDEVSRSLFRALRSLDDRAVDVIFVRAPDRSGLGEAIWDRLYRAAGGRVIEVE